MAIISSSFVRITRTAARLASVEISGAFSLFRAGQFHAEKLEPLANPAADVGRVLADPAGEHERVEPAEGRGHRADPFFRLVAEQGQGLGRPDVRRLAAEQVPHVAAGLGNAQQAAAVIDQLVKLLGRHLLAAGQEREQAGIEIAGAAWPSAARPWA